MEARIAEGEGYALGGIGGADIGWRWCWADEESEKVSKVNVAICQGPCRHGDILKIGRGTLDRGC